MNNVPFVTAGREDWEKKYHWNEEKILEEQEHERRDSPPTASKQAANPNSQRSESVAPPEPFSYVETQEDPLPNAPQHIDQLPTGSGRAELDVPAPPVVEQQLATRKPRAKKKPKIISSSKNYNITI